MCSCLRSSNSNGLGLGISLGCGPGRRIEVVSLVEELASGVVIDFTGQMERQSKGPGSGVA